MRLSCRLSLLLILLLLLPLLLLLLLCYLLFTAVQVSDGECVAVKMLGDCGSETANGNGGDGV